MTKLPLVVDGLFYRSVSRWKVHHFLSKILLSKMYYYYLFFYYQSGQKFGRCTCIGSDYFMDFCFPLEHALTFEHVS